MTWLWIAFIALATFGSLYPFDFRLSELNDLSVRTFLETCCTLSTRGDILGNIILFLPVGFTGMLAIKLDDSIRRRLWFVCLTAVTVAVVLQLLQFFLPSRDENIQDVVWNVVGTGCGVMAAIWFGSFFSSIEAEKRDLMLVPLTLAGAWVMYRLFPFVPSIDLQMMIRSVKPIFNEPLVTSDVLYDFTAWLVFAYLLSRVQRVVRLDNYLPAIVVAVFCLEIVTVYNVVNLANIVGALLAVVVWAIFLQRRESNEGALILLLAATLVVNGLAPFEFSANSANFSWLPFQGFLHGSMLINAQSATGKVFLYGSLVYLLWRTRFNLIASVLVSFTFILAIEYAQTMYLGHTPEITDPLLVVCAALAMLALDKRENSVVFVTVLSQTPVRPVKTQNKRAAWPTKMFGDWVTEDVNIRTSQLRFLHSLAEEMDISVSRVMRRIVRQFMASIEHDESLPPIEMSGAESSQSSAGPTADLQEDAADGWVREAVNLQSDQYRFLQRLADEMSCSVSRVIRRILTYFINSLDDGEEHSLGQVSDAEADLGEEGALLSDSAYEVELEGAQMSLPLAEPDGVDGTASSQTALQDPETQH